MKVKLFILISILINCKKKDIEKDKYFFERLEYNDTNIDFKNDLKETVHMNGLFYEYYYNGSGVATADFNNDGLEDIYFVSTLQNNKLYINQGHFKFKDLTDKANADTDKGFETGVTVVDINNDKLLDIYICRSGKIKDPNKRKNVLLVNQGIKDGVPFFLDKAKDYHLDIEYFSTQAGFFDFDKDGDLDMFLINHGIDVYGYEDIPYMKGKKSYNRGDRLYRNDNNIFIDITDSAGIVNNMLGYGLGLSFGDMNNDGYADIYVANDFWGKDNYYLNQKDGTFKEISKDAFRHISNFSMGVDIADINNDSYLDIMVLDMMAEDNYTIKTSMGAMNPKDFYNVVKQGQHYQYMYNTLQLNKGNNKFSDIAEMANVSSTDWSWGPLLMDINNDGYNDLFVSNGIKRDFRNTDFNAYKQKAQDDFKRRYRTKSHQSDSALSELIKDLIYNMPERKKRNYFFLNKKDLTFENMNSKWLEYDEHNCSNGAAYADFDNDGDLDIVINDSHSRAYIYKNNQDIFNENNFLKIDLEGNSKNIYGIGSRVSIRYGKNKQISERYFTRGFQSSSATSINFGLAEVDIVDTIIVDWANGKRSLLTDIKANQRIKISYSDAYDKIEKGIEGVKYFDINGIDLPFYHRENEYDEYKNQVLLPYSLSQMGPALSVADVNGDGLDDIFIGGSKGYEAQLLIQEKIGFRKSNINLFKVDRSFEDVSSLFFDVDNDGDMDLYVVSGGGEYIENSKYYKDRLYINKGRGIFSRSKSPDIYISGSNVKPYDIDNDGDLDLFVCGKLKPYNYPYPTDSYILENDGGKLKLKQYFSELGMINDAIFTDYNRDGIIDIIAVGEWTPIIVLSMGSDGNFKRENVKFFDENIGWYFSIQNADFDNDGYDEYIIGNLGINTKYKATKLNPFEIYYGDINKDKKSDIVLAYHQDGKKYPIRGKSCSSHQMPEIKDMFKTYSSFAKATLSKIYGNILNEELSYKANNFSHIYIDNMGEGNFRVKKLSNWIQNSIINSIIVEDINKDGNKDIIVGGNLYPFEVETVRLDGSYGGVLIGDGKGDFSHLPEHQSGLYIEGDLRKLKNIKIGDEYFLLKAINNKNLSLTKYIK